MRNGPDFIVIGAMKSATSTLHRQLELQDGIFMSHPKEPNFFSDDTEFKRGIDWYRNLFSGALNSDICGESSTHYTMLPTYLQTVPRIRDHLSNPKFVYIVRHPIERLISQYVHEWSQNIIKCDINNAIDKYPELVEYSLYYKQLSPFVNAFGKDSILVINFNQIKHYPQIALEHVCEHIGYKETPTWVVNEKPTNISSQRIRKFPLYDLLVDSKPASTLRRSFVPQSVRNIIKSNFIMSQRPKLNDSNLVKLKNIFDDDLAKFNKLVGSTINCDELTEHDKSVQNDRLSNVNHL